MHARLGTLWLAKNKPGEAVTAYEAAVAAQPDLAEAHCNLADAELRTGSDDAALASTGGRSSSSRSWPRRTMFWERFSASDAGRPMLASFLKRRG